MNTTNKLHTTQEDTELSPEITAVAEYMNKVRDTVDGFCYTQGSMTHESSLYDDYHNYGTLEHFVQANGVEKKLREIMTYVQMDRNTRSYISENSYKNLSDGNTESFGTSFATMYPKLIYLIEVYPAIFKDKQLAEMVQEFHHRLLELSELQKANREKRKLKRSSGLQEREIDFDGIAGIEAYKNFWESILWKDNEIQWKPINKQAAKGMNYKKNNTL